jgi:hypothetical protein
MKFLPQWFRLSVSLSSNAQSRLWSRVEMWTSTPGRVLENSSSQNGTIQAFFRSLLAFRVKRGISEFFVSRARFLAPLGMTASTPRSALELTEGDSLRT